MIVEFSFSPLPADYQESDSITREGNGIISKIVYNDNLERIGKAYYANGQCGEYVGFISFEEETPTESQEYQCPHCDQVYAQEEQKYKHDQPAGHTAYINSLLREHLLHQCATLKLYDCPEAAFLYIQ